MLAGGNKLTYLDKLQVGHAAWQKPLAGCRTPCISGRLHPRHASVSTDGSLIDIMTALTAQGENEVGVRVTQELKHPALAGDKIGMGACGLVDGNCPKTWCYAGRSCIGQNVHVRAAIAIQRCQRVRW